MYDARTNLSAEVAAEVRRHLGDAVYDTVVPRSVRLAEAPSHGRPIALYAPDSRGAAAYRALADGAPRSAAQRDSRRSEAPHDRHAPCAPGDRSAAASPRSSRRPSPSTPGPAEIPIDRIERNPLPAADRLRARRRSRELAASIAAHGVLQPVLVTETLDGYQLVAGERRLRAAQLAGLERIPAVVRQASRAGPARARARREPPAGGPQRDGGGPRLPPAPSICSA